MNELHEIRYNKILTEIKSLNYLLDKCGERIILNKVNNFFTNEELFFFLSSKVTELKKKIINLSKLLNVQIL